MPEVWSYTTAKRVKSVVDIFNTAEIDESVVRAAFRCVEAVVAHTLEAIIGLKQIQNSFCQI